VQKLIGSGGKLSFCFLAKLLTVHFYSFCKTVAFLKDGKSACIGGFLNTIIPHIRQDLAKHYTLQEVKIFKYL
jgi:hypothetical protein